MSSGSHTRDRCIRGTSDTLGGNFEKNVPSDKGQPVTASASYPHTGELAPGATFINFPKAKGNTEFYVNLPTF